MKPYGGSNQYQNKSYSNHSSAYGGGNSNSGGYQRQSNPQGYNSGGYSKPKVLQAFGFKIFIHS